MDRLTPYLLVGVGSLLGGVARFALGRHVSGMAEGRFPLGTFLVNVIGSFVLGVLAAALLPRSGTHADALRLAVGVGFCGGFTTFSAFALETHALLEDGAFWPAAANVAASVAAGLLALRLGVLIGRSWL
jgi:CrcB protein